MKFSVNLQWHDCAWRPAVQIQTLQILRLFAFCSHIFIFLSNYWAWGRNIYTCIIIAVIVSLYCTISILYYKSIMYYYHITISIISSSSLKLLLYQNKISFQLDCRECFEHFSYSQYVIVYALWTPKFLCLSSNVVYANEAKWIAHSAENLYKLGNSPRARESLVRPSRPGA